MRHKYAQTAVIRRLDFGNDYFPLRDLPVLPVGPMYTFTDCLYNVDWSDMPDIIYVA